MPACRWGLSGNSWLWIARQVEIFEMIISSPPIRGFHATRSLALFRLGEQ